FSRRWMERSSRGSVQMDLESRANGNHRAEVMKMFVHSGVRRRGPARALMSEVDAAAHGFGPHTAPDGHAKKAARPRRCASCSDIRSMAKSPATPAAGMARCML